MDDEAIHFRLCKSMDGLWTSMMYWEILDTITKLMNEETDKEIVIHIYNEY